MEAQLPRLIDLIPIRYTNRPVPCHHCPATRQQIWRAVKLFSLRGKEAPVGRPLDIEPAATYHRYLLFNAATSTPGTGLCCEVAWSTMQTARPNAGGMDRRVAATA